VDKYLPKLSSYANQIHTENKMFETSYFERFYHILTGKSRVVSLEENTWGYFYGTWFS